MNEYSIRKTFEALQKQDEPIEVRIVSGKATFSGYFRDIDNLIEKLKPFDKVSTANIYFVLNKINDACYDRQQCEMFIQNAKQTTSDGDIVHRDWLLIDIDPVRSAGVSSSEKEKANAKNVANAVYSYLKSKGFAKPISCDSGNGWHLLYKIRMANDDSARDTIKKFLQTLDMMFSDETAQIDTSVFNASRITKLYGTIARKGNNSKTRPHRESSIIRIPDEVLVNRKALLQKVIDELPQPETPTYKNNYNKEPFDIDNFIARHSIRVSKIVNYGLGRKFVLEECVFDSNHKAPDACIFAMNNGAIGYKCFHNSCQRYTWKDVRIKFEPDAYDKKEREYSKQRTTKPTGTTIAELIGKAKPTDETKVFVQMSEIEAVDRSQLVTIPSGFTELDKKIIGFNKGEISLWSGRNGCVDCDTEFMSQTGWKKISDYKKGDLVLQYNADGTACFVEPKQFHKYECKELNHIYNHNRTINQCVSDEHNLVYFTTKGNLYKRNAKEIVGILNEKHKFNASIIPHFNYSGNGIDLSNDEIRLCIACSADGHKMPHGKSNWRFNLKKDCKKNRLRQLLTRLDIPFREVCYNQKEKGFTTFLFKYDKGFKVFPKNWINSNSSQLAIIKEEIVLWDGTIDARGAHIYRTTIKENADFIQFVMSALGKRTSILLDDRIGAPIKVKYTKKSICYSVRSIKEESLISMNNPKGICVDRVETKDGYKYCFTVDSGMLVLRKDGAINITGNSAKSTVLNQICLNACQDGFKCAIFSGELTKQRIKQWIQLQAAGKQNVAPSKKYENLFYVPQQTGEKIDKWLDGKLWIYDNAFGNKFESVLNYLKELVESKNIDMIVLDNLMALDILTLNGDKYQQQTTMILALVDFVKTYNVHLHIVCHPRKAATFLRKDDISGTADLTNAVDNVFIIHRVGNDFVQSAKDFYGDAYASKFYGFGNVIEVCKNRDLGIMDELFGFFFETQSKRLLNDVFENVCYGWEESPTRFFNEENMQFVSFTELPFDIDEEWEDGDLPY